MNILEKKRELSKYIKESKNIFIMGHKGLDLDALGSSLGMYDVLSKKRKLCFLVIDDKENELGVSKVIDKVKTKVNIIKSSEINKNKCGKDLLLILDCNKAFLLQNEKALDYFDKVVVIDHHDTNAKTIENALVIVDKGSSSTCEMITELVYYYDINLSSEVSTIILSGIVLDTNNFVLKTTAKTYFAAYYLATQGADPKEVQYLLKQDIEDYKVRQKVITDIEVIKKTIALSVGSQKVKYRKEDLAKIADTLLQFNNIEVSFVIGKIDDETIGLSARSIGTINVSKIAEQLGGGGDNHEAAAQIKNRSLNDVEAELKSIISKLR